MGITIHNSFFISIAEKEINIVSSKIKLKFIFQDCYSKHTHKGGMTANKNKIPNSWTYKARTAFIENRLIQLIHKNSDGTNPVTKI
jgi:hypothetical protein